MDSQLQITIYTDGACDIHAANKPGGWAAILLATDADGKAQKERVISGGAEMTTNNQMELRAVIEALKRLRQPAEARIVTDSRYVIDIASGKKRALTNAKLWREYRDLAASHSIDWRYVAGHSGHRFNERCDAIAVAEKNKLARKSADSTVAARPSDIQIYLSTRYAGAKRLSVWAAVITDGAGSRELSGSQQGKTEQETVLLAAIQCIGGQPAASSVALFTAQEYLSKGMNQWTRGWRANGWKTRDGKPVKYRDHWRTLAAFMRERDLQCIFVKARKGKPHFQRGAELTAALLKSAN